MKYPVSVSPSSNAIKSWNLFKFITDPSELSASETLCLLLIIFIFTKFYLGWSDDKKKRREEIVRSDVPKADNSAAETVGPYGGGPGQKFSFLCVKDHQKITKIMVKHGVVIDGIGLEVTDRSGQISIVWFGGLGGGHSEVELAHDEYVTQITGEYGVWCDHSGHYSKVDIIIRLELFTTKRPFGIGSFGESRGIKGQLHRFRLSAKPGHAITGLFGTFGSFLHSLGAYTQVPTDDGA